MRIDLYCEASVLPEDYRRVGLSVIKGLINGADPVLYRELYESGKNRKKPFTYYLFFSGELINGFYYVKSGAFKLSFATSSPEVASAVLKSASHQPDISVHIAKSGKMSVKVERFKVLSDELSPDVLVLDFVLPVKAILQKNPDFFKGCTTFYDKVEKYLTAVQGLSFEKLIVGSKKTVYGIKTYKNRAFYCCDLKLYGARGDLARLYSEGIGHYKSQGFGFPLPLKAEEKPKKKELGFDFWI
jgi:CRISPR/Cas system endoribonuclease Cas6 (RAMP superfamily)